MNLNLRKLKINKNQKDYLFTFLTEFIVLCLSILVYKFSAKVLGVQGFSIYALSRRTVSFIQPIIMIGIGVALPRYIAYCLENKKDIKLYLISSILLYLLSSVVLLSLFIVFKYSFSKLFFESATYSYLITPIVLYIFSIGFHSLIYGYFRGRLLMIKANLLGLINMGMIPVLSFLFFHDLLSILVFSSASVVVVSIVFIYPNISFNDINFITLKPYVKTLFNYGIRRISGDITLAGYFTIPAYLVTHVAGIIAGGYVAFAITFVNLFGAAFTPISLILLPKAAAIIQKKDFHLLKPIISKLALLTLSITIIGVLLIEIFVPEIIKIYLGQNYYPSVHVIRIIITGNIGYTLFISLRSIIDAYYIKAINTKNIILSFFVMMISIPLMYIFKADNSIIIYLFALSINVLGLLTLFNVLKIIKLNS